MKIKKSFKTLSLALGVLTLPIATLSSCAIAQPIVADTYLSTQAQVVQTQVQNSDTWVVLVPENSSIKHSRWSEQTSNYVQSALKVAGFTGAAGQIETLLTPPGLDKVNRLVFVGVGNPADTPRYKIEETGGNLAGKIESYQSKEVTIDGSLIQNEQQNARILAQISHGVDLRNYRFDRFISKAKPRPNQNYIYISQQNKQTEAEMAQLKALSQGVFLARELTNLPGSNGYPEAFAKIAKETLAPLGVDVKILGPKEIKALGIGALYGVSQGSQHPAYMVVAHYKGSSQQPIALVGKGISFDTGGYNLKTNAASIVNMQTDKAGAASVMGAVAALAGQKAKVNVVGIAPLAHNLISGTAQLPGDVVTTGSGLTIEVANTDAEGRLVLADGLWYANEFFKPKAMADIATLTGAKVTALGTEFAGVFANNEQVYQNILAASELVRERVWRLPLDPAFEPSIKSRIADLKNTGSPGASAGAMLLQHFVGETPWVHIDIAGNALVQSDQGIHPRGATGFGVRLLTEWVKTESAQ